MKKNVYACLIIFLFAVYFAHPMAHVRVGSFPSLRALTTRSFFDFKNEFQKQNLKEKLKDHAFRESLRFDGLIVECLDLSGMCLKGINFDGGTFKNINFSNSDLREATFTGCKFESCDLKNALLYSPDSTVSMEEVGNSGFRVTHWDPVTLLNHYSDLMNEIETKKEDIGSKVALIKSNCLNKFFPILDLYLYGKQLCNLNLRGIDLTNVDLRFAHLERTDLTDANLQNANLRCAYLQGTILSKKVPLPNYPVGNHTELLNLWGSSDPEESEAVQKLVNAQFEISLGVAPERLREVIASKKNLQNAFLRDAHLEGANLTGANLQNAKLVQAHLEGADLTGANLQNAVLFKTDLERANLTNADLQNAKLNYTHLKGANFTNANLQNADLEGAHLQGTILSKKVPLPNYPMGNHTELLELWSSPDPDKSEAIQKLVNARFNISLGVAPEMLREVIASKKNLQNANLVYADLQGANLTGANLQNADLRFAHLERTDLTGANLQNADLWDADLEGADLTDANLQNAKLYKAQLEGANLTGANLQNADLEDACLQGTILSKKVTLPNYPVDNHTELLELWSSPDPDKSEAIQKLVNAKFQISLGVAPERLREVIASKKNLQNANLVYARLEGADLTNANLQKANLERAYLQGAILTGANLQNADLRGAQLKDIKLQGASIGGIRLSETFRLPTTCKDEDLMAIYGECNNEVAKMQLKYILKGKGIHVE